jgi:hypothetical protein
MFWLPGGFDPYRRCVIKPQTIGPHHLSCPLLCLHTCSHNSLLPSVIESRKSSGLIVCAEVLIELSMVCIQQLNVSLATIQVFYQTG